MRPTPRRGAPYAPRAPRATATQMDEAPGRPGTEGFRDQGKSDAHDSADFDPQCKSRATVAAEAARAGCTLHELAGGGFLLARWGLTRELPTLREVGDLLRRIGGKR